jgi:hypothetical protein
MKTIKIMIPVFLFLFLFGCALTIHDAIRYEDDPLAEELISQGLDLNLRDENGDTPLHLAVKKNNLKIVQSLLEEGADPNLKDALGFTPLHLSTQQDFDQISKLLLQSGADVHSESNGGNTPTYFAIQEGNLDFVKMVCIDEAGVNTSNSIQQTPLHVASEFGKLEIVKYLVDTGAEINAKNKYSRTPLHAALYQDNDQIANYLVKRGAEVSMIGITTSDLYVTARAYHLFAGMEAQAGDSKLASTYYRIAMAYYEKASTGFSIVAQDFASEAKKKKWLNALEYMGAVAQAYSSAMTSVSGYGMGLYAVRETASLEEAAESMKTKSEFCHTAALKCFMKLDCLENSQSGEAILDCLNEIDAKEREELLGTSVGQNFEEQQRDNYKLYSDTREYRNYINDIVDRSDRKDIAGFILPTYETMLAGAYEGIDDTNVELAVRSSPEMFLNAWLNTPSFVSKFDILSDQQRIEDGEFLVGMTTDSILTNLRLFIIDDDRVSMIVDLAETRKIEQDIGFASVTTRFILRSGEIRETKKSVPKPEYMEIFNDF